MVPKRTHRHIDKDGYATPLPGPRRSISIADKYKVVQHWKQLKEKKEKDLQEAIDAAAAEQLSETDSAEKKKRLRKQKPGKRGGNLQAQCKEKFPDIVGKTQVCKWVAASEREAWREIPAALMKLKTVPNSIRSSKGLPLKGRKEGGQVPIVLQQELDMLISEAAQGHSEISSRRQIVTVGHIEACQKLKA